MAQLSEYARKRNEALFSLDYDKILAFFSSQGMDMSDVEPELVWIVIYKMICNVKNPPAPVLRQAKEWLRDHGYSAMVQPYVIHDICC